MKAKTEAQERMATWGYEECAGYDTGPVTLIRRIREGARSLQVRRVQRECFTRIKNDGSISHVVEAATSELHLRHYREFLAPRVHTHVRGRLSPENDPSP